MSFVAGKLITLFLVFGTVVFASISNVEEIAKANGDASKPASRLVTFLINKKMNTSWVAGPTKFDEWSWSSIKRLMGVPLIAVQNQHITRQLETREHDLASLKEDLPDSFDSREHWPDCPTIKEIRDQGNCGSCWAISAVETMSDRVCVASGGKQAKHLSTEDLMDCCHSCGFGCNGGYPQMAWEYFKHKGIVSGGLYNSTQGCKPYTIEACEHHSTGQRIPCQGDAKTPKCERACSNHAYNLKYSDDLLKGRSVYTIKKEDQIRAEIMKNGPVQTAFSVYEDFISYKSGVYEHKVGQAVGGHAVKIVGWGVDAESKMPYWLVANSWNSDWAEQGFFRIVRGKNECEIEQNVVTGEPQF